MSIQVTQGLIEYVRRFGGRCRDCADERGICPSSGLPCANPEKAINHVFRAYNYGIKNGFIKPREPRL
jgi:hypothetical protein